jgi:hypothetical protein
MSYSLANVHNQTPYFISGDVDYYSFLCRNDSYNASSDGFWTASSRGECLITKVTATVHTPTGDVAAVSFDPSGDTAASKFAVQGPDANSQYVVVCLDESGESRPVDYLEPTDQQK